MADKKISALPSATTPLTGSEVLPVVQGGVTDKVSVNNLTAGRTVPATRLSMPTPSHTMYVGYDGATDAMQIATQTEINLQTGSGYGMAVNIDSSHNVNVSQGNVKIGTAGKGIDFSANGGDVLSQYDEGTWTPTVTATSGTLTTVTATGNYTRIGRCVTANFEVTLTNVGTASGALIVSLPFTAGQFPAIGTGREDQNTGISLQARIQSSLPTVTYVLSYANGTIIATGNVVQCTITYFV